MPGRRSFGLSQGPNDAGLAASPQAFDELFPAGDPLQLRRGAGRSPRRLKGCEVVWRLWRN